MRRQVTHTPCAENETSGPLPLLSRTQCTMLKAIAIVMIMAHNFAHHIHGMVQENEYTHSLSRTMDLWHTLVHPDSQILLHLISFFGHYGVPLFLFLSGYGLVMKYESPGMVMPRRWRFVAQHYGKLLRLMLVGFLAFLLYLYFTHQPISKVNVAAQLTMVVNLLSAPWYRIKPGPYWFFGLMLQVYVLYRLVFYARPDAKRWRWVGPLTLIAVCHLVQTVGMACGGAKTLYWMRYNVLVAGLPFGLGLLAGRYTVARPLKRWMGWVAVAVAAAAVMLMELHFQPWLLAPVAVIVGGITLVRVLPLCTHRLLLWIGGLSPMLFAVHPLVRAAVIDTANASHPHLWLLAYLLLSVVLAIPYRWVVRKLP